MDLEELKQKINTDDQFVLSEVEKIRYTYKLKKEIRYAQNRDPKLDTESVAEHIYGMHILAQYFISLEDQEGKADFFKILRMITWHDMDELETGDTVSYWKTAVHVAEAKRALPIAISKLPESLQKEVTDLMAEYEAQETFEANFVKAIDKIEPLFEVWEDYYIDILQKNKNTIDNHWDTKRKYLENFPFIMRFANVATARLVERGFFYTEPT